MKIEELKPAQAVVWNRPAKRYAERVTVFRVDAAKNQVIIVDQKGKFHAISVDQLAALPKTRAQKKEQNHA